MPSMSRDPRRALAEAAAAAYEGDARAQATAGRLLLDEPDGNPVQARDWLAAARAAGEFVSPDFIDLAERRVATAGMTDIELLDDCIAVAGAGHLAPAIRAAVRPSLRLVASRVDADDDIVFGASKLGGGPDLAMGSEWPGVDGRRLAFVGQLALDGQPLLGFFYDAIAAAVGSRARRAARLARDRVADRRPGPRDAARGRPDLPLVRGRAAQRADDPVPAHARGALVPAGRRRLADVHERGQRVRRSGRPTATAASTAPAAIRTRSRATCRCGSSPRCAART